MTMPPAPVLPMAEAWPPCPAFDAATDTFAELLAGDRREADGTGRWRRRRTGCAASASALDIRGMVLHTLRARAGLVMPLVVGLFGL